MDKSATSVAASEDASDTKSSRLAIVDGAATGQCWKGKRAAPRRLLLGVGILVAAALLATSVALPVWYLSSDRPSPPPAPSARVSWPPATRGRLGLYRFAAVSSDSTVCSDIGREMLTSHGSAVDAAIATMLCVGVVHPQSTGIGGGSFMTVYDRSTNTSVVYDFREQAPRASTEDMYSANASLSTQGGMAVAVPGEIAGYRLAWERHGKLPWKALFRRTIQLCEEGVTVNPALADALASSLEGLRLNAPLREEFFDKTGESVAKEGNTIFRRRLARTLRILAEDPYAFYNGSLAEDIVADIKENGGIIDLDDLRGYTVKVKQPAGVTLPRAGVRLVYPPPPSSGAVLGLILSILDDYNFTSRDLSDAQSDIDTTTTTIHRVLEAFKHGYAKRSLLGDPDYADLTEIMKNLTSPDFANQLRRKIFDNVTHDTLYYEPAFYNRTNTGTSHASVVDSLGNAVAITSTINLSFGAMFMGPRTGIIFNNEMDDFSSPNASNSFGYLPSVANFIRPGKRPLSSMCPSIAIGRRGEPRLVFGASGGSRIISASAWVAINQLYFGMSAKEAIDMPRLHHQLEPNYIRAEDGFPSEYKTGLQKKGHTFLQRTGISNAVTNAVATLADGLQAYADTRKGGGTDGY